MPRKKAIDSSTVVDMTQAYITHECHGNAANVTYEDVAQYIQQNGYPDFNRKKYSRCKEAVAFLKQAKDSSHSIAPAVVIAYKTLDVEKYLRMRPVALREALTALNSYYQSVADSAVLVLEDAKKQAACLASTRSELESCQNELTLLAEECRRLKQVKNENASLRKYIEEYVIPDICNQVLARNNKLFVSAKTIISDDTIDKHIISPDKKLVPELTVETSSSESALTEAAKIPKTIENIIGGLFDLGEDPNG